MTDGERTAWKFLIVTCMSGQPPGVRASFAEKVRRIGDADLSAFAAGIASPTTDEQNVIDMQREQQLWN